MFLGWPELRECGEIADHVTVLSPRMMTNASARRSIPRPTVPVASFKASSFEELPPSTPPRSTVQDLRSTIHSSVLAPLNDKYVSGKSSSRRCIEFESRLTLNFLKISAISPKDC